MSFIRKLRGGDEFIDSRIGNIVEAYLIFGMRDRKAMEAENARIQQLANDQTTDAATRDHAAAISRCFQWIPWESAQDATEYLHRKIELSQPFMEIEP